MLVVEDVSCVSASIESYCIYIYVWSFIFDTASFMDLLVVVVVVVMYDFGVIGEDFKNFSRYKYINGTIMCRSFMYNSDTKKLTKKQKKTKKNIRLEKRKV